MSISNYRSMATERLLRAFQEAVTYKQFSDEAIVNKEILEANYEAYLLNEQDLAFFESLEQPLDVLVLAHDWCGDVVANLPLFGKIADQTHKLNLHILPRDPDNQDIAELYLHPDGRNHIPTYIFFNQAGEELGVFIERPEEISALFSQWIDAFWANHPEYEGRGKAIGELEETVKKSLLGYFREQRAEVLDQEKGAVIRIINNFSNQ
ncbi:hypothetical protein Back11_18780 [Paenibacillus baekrokdamisoli]|uniref:Uncharacterized protein n=1 Tax=Paenibacillus baekrokdamisoli TaxID=1712516 RepID=A0A3G9J6R9_9BACL|nr:thioredoxin family protein [Paenibacillus baekrokdamisoli]MBB3072476.1 hypothetical protein [Paenibacillus baekrokdamisoli]BBH20533.1 hypothetical protein Back11_18780 [Paenibacillus baekrokdamisoli]